ARPGRGGPPAGERREGDLRRRLVHLLAAEEIFLLQERQERRTHGCPNMADMTLGWILAASFAGGTLSAGLAAFALTLRASWVPMLVSYAIGALLGAAFLGVIPEAFAKGPPHLAAGAILAGIFAFFVLEKLLLWRHCHTENCEVHDPHERGHSDHGRTGALIMVGDTVHNFVDGVLIAAAFLESTELGLIAALAIIAHEIPQE